MIRLLLLAATVTLIGTTARADQIDKRMVEHADKLFAAAKSLGAKNWTVLKFSFKVGDGAGSFNAGTVNARTANRLEHLLILKNDPDNPTMVLTNAGPAVEALGEKMKTPITWRTAEGRKLIAQIAKLPLAWDEKVALTPEGFLTGEVITSADYKTTAIKFYGFTRSDPATLKELCTFDEKGTGGSLRTDRGMLASYGQSFNLAAKARSLNAEGDDAEAAQDAAKRDKTGKPPIATQDQQPDDAQSPVRLQIFFGGKEQPWQTDKGESKIAVTPRAGDKVTFRLTNTSATDSYAVILAVNGKNTNAMDNDTLLDKAPHEQRKWVLGPKEDAVIKGFYLKPNGEFNPFEVLPENASARRFGALNEKFRGRISLLVFGKRAEAPAEPKVTVTPSVDLEKLKDDGATAKAIDLAGGAWKIRNTGSLASAQKVLSGTTNVVDQEGRLAVALVAKGRYTAGKRGLIESSGETKKDGPIVRVPLVYDPWPMCHLDIVYYVPSPPAGK
ncbi:hypothetical protein [Limnoglobus roseus]|uniref:Uncharacterized protein n=1 Tax=Limnoglobus roseus TaxID=2598579 RepID=A0A5C1AUL7_9BACT|nr:hypothetical protein [Limnoglobus roseus]QEL20944.1 hypothetical protein PX52LOC_08072 [Limnoglobus roseus]